MGQLRGRGDQICKRAVCIYGTKADNFSELLEVAEFGLTGQQPSRTGAESLDLGRHEAGDVEIRVHRPHPRAESAAGDVVDASVVGVSSTLCKNAPSPLAADAPTTDPVSCLSAYFFCTTLLLNYPFGYLLVAYPPPPTSTLS